MNYVLSVICIKSNTTSVTRKGIKMNLLRKASEMG